VLVAGQVDHPGELLRAARLGADVMPDVFIDPEDPTLSKRVGSAAITTSSGLTARHTVDQVVPS
jgi:hypothetical protein